MSANNLRYDDGNSIADVMHLKGTSMKGIYKGLVTGLLALNAI